jgi:hypothetical protein
MTMKTSSHAVGTSCALVIASMRFVVMFDARKEKPCVLFRRTGKEAHPQEKLPTPPPSRSREAVDSMNDSYENV